MGDWRPVRNALELAYAAIGEAHSGNLPERDWKLAEALKTAFVEQSERTCAECSRRIPYREEIVCLDCGAPLHKTCATAHFWPTGRAALEAHGVAQ